MSVCLLYHGIGPGPPGGQRALDVPSHRFENQMRCIKRRRSISITFDDAYLALADFALPFLLELGLTATVFVVAGAVGGVSSWTGEARGRPIMTQSQLREFHARGIEFGAHSLSHPDLTRLTDADAEAEIGGSKAALEDILSSPVTSFAYPYGAYDRRIRDIAARHYARAFTTQEGRNEAGDDPLALKRTMVQPFNPHWDFHLQCRLGYSPLEMVRRWRRR
jgi:peptidoglycan/xylan/chitin deacetylase (PgdA/CDA1 family)